METISRAEIKAQAKAALRENYGSKMLLFIIPIIFSILASGNAAHEQFEVHSQNINTASGAFLSGLAAGVFMGALLGIVLGLIVYIIEAAGIFCYLRIFRKEQENPPFADVFIPFRDGSWSKILLLYLIQVVLLTLLSLTIVGIPFAIYLGLGWSQAIYVLYEQLENGSYQGSMAVLKKSAELMRGKRGNFFVFLLSFIGWFILTGITGGLVGFWTIPYIAMSEISYYENLVRPEN